MLSDEEKKAIEMIEYIQECNTLIGYRVEDRTILAKALLNLIDKQYKEIEGLIEVSKECIEEKFNNDQKWEDKIKAGIEEARKRYNDLHTKHLRDCGIAEQRELAKIEFGQSLLEKE